MRNKWVKLLALTLAGAITLSGCGGGTEEKDTSANNNSNTEENTQEPSDDNKENEGEEQASGDAITMWTWLGTEEFLNMGTGDIMAVQELSNRTGIATEWINPADSATEFQMIMTSGEDMPDCMFYKYTPQDVLKYSANGNIIDLAPYVDQYMPNFKAILDGNARLKAQITSEDGQIFYFPWVTEGKYYYEGMMIRKDWLEATGLAVPNTAEELYQVLKAEKELFDKGELPNAGSNFYGLSGYLGQLLKLQYGFNTTNDFLIKDGQLVYGPTTDEFREAMKWFYKLSTEGLIDPDVLSSDRDLYMQHHTNNTTAGFIDGIGFFQEVTQASGIEYVPVGYLQDANGVRNEYNSTAKRVAQPYGWAVTKDGADKIEDICKLFDYAYSEEGQVLMSWGVEGDTFEVVNGEKVYTDKIMNDPEYVPSTASAKYVKPDFGTTDILVNFAMLDDLGRETFALWGDTVYDDAMEPSLWTTEEETETINQILTDLRTGADETRDKFITGALDPNDDATWETYQNTLKSLRVDDITAAYNAAYQRFIERAK